MSLNKKSIHNISLRWVTWILAFIKNIGILNVNELFLEIKKWIGVYHTKTLFVTYESSFS